MATRPKRSSNTIESSVTKLLVSTKHLLESLTQWARREVDDKFVSDAYVKLGNDFRGATRAFTQAGVDITDIGDVPQALRVILESALSEPAGQESLDRFLPDIRNIIVTLLQNLKTKQSRLRESSNSQSQQPQQQQPQYHSRPVPKPFEESTPEPVSNHVTPTREIHNNAPTRDNNHTPTRSRFSRSEISQPQNSGYTSPENNGTIDIPKQRLRHSPKKELESKPEVIEPESQPQPQPQQPPSINQARSPKSPRAKDEALLQLQNESVLSRRASKRFSAYQYAKLANINPSNSLPNVNVDKRNPSVSLRDTIRNSSINYTPKPVETKDNDTYIFLKIDNQTKKVFVKPPITFASLRLLFVEKFAYSPGSSDFPTIYIEDPKTSVSYELEDQFLSDIQTGTLLGLNDTRSVEKEADETFDNQTNLKGLESTVNDLQQKFDSFSMELTNTIKEAIKELPNKQQQQLVPPVTDEQVKPKSLAKPISAKVIQDMDAIEKELRIVRQIQGSSKKSIESFVNDLTNKVKQIQDSGVDSYKSSNRVYMEKCHSKLSEESDSLLTKVDDLQDLMEGLRKDVAQRGVRISTQQLSATLKEINEATDSLKSMTGYISNEKSVWKKIWESELDRVCEEQQFFNLQDDLTRDLEEDISKIRETYDLIEQCSVEQGKLGGSRRNKVVANLYIPEPGESLHNIKDAVLSEVASLKPDHESRVEAINRAERLREREREMLRTDEFQEELENFVDDSKLKKSGGIDEIERQRQLKDAENLKSNLVI